MRIPIIIPIKGRGFIDQVSGLGFMAIYGLRSREYARFQVKGLGYWSFIKPHVETLGRPTLNLQPFTSILALFMSCDSAARYSVY